MLQDKVEVLEEKIKLAKELGMGDWAETREAQLREVKQITGLSFKPVDQAYIENAIEKAYWEPREGNYLFLVIGTVFMNMVACIWAVPGGSTYIPHSFWPTALVILGIQVFNFGACAWRMCECKSMPIKEWKDNLPRGAMLAMKEAHEQKIGNFQIYYPTKEKERVQADPIIVGFAQVKEEIRYSRDSKWGSVMLKIHEWDDGKVYEENKM